MYFSFKSEYVLKRGLLLLLILISCKPGGKPAAGEDAVIDTVKIQSGLITGKLIPSGEVRMFLGIPYAAPPVSNLRWKAPQPPVQWTGVRKCTEFSPVSMQEDPWLHAAYSSEFLIDPKAPRSEDCLYLNVWTGAKSEDEKRPVLVWIHGGGFFGGSGSIPVYDGEAMAKNGIVFVNFNYRLGIFGFFAHPELTQESDYRASGNYALLDQIAALRWVKNNIAAFGGNPDNITIDGQSVGSMSVSYLLASPLTKGLYQHAIAESGPGVTKGSSSGVSDLAEVEKKGVEYAVSVNAKKLSDLRSLPDSILMKSFRKFLNPVVDGYVIPGPIYNIISEGKQNDVPLILGWNQGDGYIDGPLKSASDFRDKLKKRYDKTAVDLLKIYPAGKDGEAAASQLNYSRDTGFGAGTFSWASLHAKTSSSKVYVYFFSRKTPPANPGLAKYGAFHTANVVYELENLNRVSRAWEPADNDLSGIMSTYWKNFISTGDPNGENIPAWPIFNPDDGKVMIFDKISGPAELPDLEGIRLILKNTR